MRSNNFILRFRPFVAALLVLLFSAYYINITLFSHSHVVDGATIVHSHIHSANHGDGSDEEGSHSRGEYAIIDQLSHFVAEEQVALFLAVVALIFAALYLLIYRVDVALQERSYETLRGPPVARAVA